MDAGSSAVPPTGEEESGKRRPPPPDPSGRRRLYREPEEKKLAGICGGLADYTGVDPALVRAGAVLLTLVSPFLVIAYLVAVFVVDERPPSVPRLVAPPVEVLERHRWLPLAVIAGAVLVGVDGPWWWWPSIDVPLTAPLLIGIGVWLLLRSREAEETDGPGGPQGPVGPEAPAEAEAGAGAGEPFAASTEATQNVAERRSQNPWSPGQEPSNLSLGVDITTRNEESGRTVDQTADLRDAADHEAEDGGLDPSPGSPPADEGAGPPGEFPPLTPPEWSGPEPSPSSAAPSPGSPFPSPGAAAPQVVVPPPGPAAPAATAPVSAPGRGTERLGLAVTALVLIGGGVVWFLHAADIAEPDPRLALGGGLVVIGLGLVVAAWRGRARAALVPLGFAAVGVLMVAEVVDVPLDAGIAERSVVATRRSQVDEPVELLAGELTLDLRDLPLDRRRPTEVEAGVGFGELEVIVPADAEVAVDLHVQAGEAAGLNPTAAGHTGGAPVDESFTIEGPPRAPRLELTLDVGIGKIEVVHG